MQRIFVASSAGLRQPVATTTTTRRMAAAAATTRSFVLFQPWIDTDPFLSLDCKNFSTNSGRDGNSNSRTLQLLQSTSTAHHQESSSSSSSTDNRKSGGSTSTSKARAYAELAKARLSALVVTTTAAGFVAAGPAPLSTHPSALGFVLAGTALCASSAAAWNQILEIPRDRIMKRTQQRPLVSGTLTLPQAYAAATLWGGTGSALLWWGTDPLTTALGVSNIVLYAGIYTALKPISVTNTWVGAVVGAVPPVMGYTAAAAAACGDTGSVLLLLGLDPILWTLGSTLYFWQLPHFMALSYMYRADYARGGFHMVPCHTVTGAESAEVASQQTADIVVRYAWYLAAVPVVSTCLHVTSSMFALEGIALNAYALAVAYNFKRDRTNANARKIFLTSLWYLPSILVLFLLHSKTWDDPKEEGQMNNTSGPVKWLSDQIHKVRNKGRELCLHEHQAAVFKKSNSTSSSSSSGDGQQQQGVVVPSCPVVVGKTQGRETAATAARVVVAAATAETLPLPLPSRDSDDDDDDDPNSSPTATAAKVNKEASSIDSAEI